MDTVSILLGVIVLMGIILGFVFIREIDYKRKLKQKETEIIGPTPQDVVSTYYKYQDYLEKRQDFPVQNFESWLASVRNVSLRGGQMMYEKEKENILYGDKSSKYLLISRKLIESASAGQQLQLIALVKDIKGYFITKQIKDYYYTVKCKSRLNKTYIKDPSK